MLSASVSGMGVAQTRLDVAADDIANVSTAGHRPGRVESAEAPALGGALVTGVSRSDQAPPDGMSGTDLTDSIPETIVAGAAYAANAVALRTQDETIGDLLDVLA